MKKILIFYCRFGHQSLAEALEGYLKKKYKIFSVNLAPEPKISLYTPIYRYFPSLFKVPYQIGRQKQICNAVKLISQKWLEKEVSQVIKKIQPDLIISCWLIYNPAIVKFLSLQLKKIPFFNLIANPWTIHPLEVSPQADLNLVYDEKSKKLCQKLKIPEKKIFVCGWPVRKIFYQRQNLAQLRKKIGLKKNILTLLICGGSEGTNMILKIIPTLFFSSQPLQTIIVCGNNKTLYQSLLLIKKLLKNPTLQRVFTKKSVKKLGKLKIITSTKKLNQYLALSHLVIGKAGPNLLFESVACQKPFFAICHIHGQEDGNLEIIKQKKLGLAEENLPKAINYLNKIISQPSLLKKFKPYLLKEKNYNLKAEKKILNLAQSWLV